MLPSAKANRFLSPLFRPGFRRAGLIAGLTFAYLLAAKLGLLLAFGQTHASPVWPPSGIALAALAIFGKNIWPGILAGAFAANLLGFLEHHSLAPAILAVSGAIAIGNSLEALVGNFLVDAWLRRSFAQEPRGALKFVLVAAVMCLVSASIGPASLCLGGLAPWSLYPKIVFTWWLGDVTGVLLVAPFFLAWEKSRGTRPSTKQIRESVFLLLLLTAFAHFVFSGNWDFFGAQPRAFVLAPILILIAFRCGAAVTFFGMILVSGFSIFGALRGTGPFSGGDLDGNLLLLQIFLGIKSTTLLVLTASLAEKNRVARELQTANATLESRVEARTATLMHSEKQYRDLFENAIDTILIIDPDSLRFLAVNENAVRQYGYTREEFRELPSSDLQGGNDLDAIAERRRIFQRDGRITGESLHRKKDGTVLPVEVDANLIDYGGRKVIQVFSRDISERNRQREALLESEERFRQLSNAALEGLTIHDQGNIVAANNALAILFGYEPAELIGMSASQLAAPESKEIIRRNIELSVEAAYEVSGLRKDGTTFPLEVRGRPIRYQGRDMRVTALRDITERKAAEALYRQSLASMEAANQAKSRFLTTVSHEIRTPLNGIIGVTNLMADTHLTGPQGKYMQTLRTCGENLLVLVNDVLDLEKVESGKMELERIDFKIGRVVEGVLDMMGEKARCKGLILRQEVGPDWSLRGDANRIRQILINLVGNAVKFTEQGEVRVDVSAESETTDGVILRFSVSDTGIGIPAASLEQIFQPFTQVDSSMSRRFGGSGLGLAISRQLAELMGGTLEVESRPGQGSRFTLSLRLEKSPDTKGAAPTVMTAPVGFPDSPAPSPLSPETKKQRPHILVVEDHPVNQQVIQWILETHDCRCRVAKDGPEAVELFRHEKFDLVLMDCQLPKLDGYATTAAIRAAETGSTRVPIVAMTANAVHGDREKCLAAGMDDYLSKPVNDDALGRVFRRWLGWARKGSPVPTAGGKNSRTETVFDPANLTRMTGVLSPDEYGRVSSLIRLFLETSAESLRDLKNTVAKRSNAELRKSIHSFNGSCSTIGATAMLAALKRLEQSASGSDWEEMTNLVLALETKFQETRAPLLEMENRFSPVAKI